MTGRVIASLKPLCQPPSIGFGLVSRRLVESSVKPVWSTSFEGN
jgi:hypothetical protein